MPAIPVPAEGTNLSIVVGSLSRPPELRTLPSGDEVLALEVTVRAAAGPAESVPVSWFAAPSSALAWSAGDRVLVVGRVRRRFFRAGGATQSRTEVVASTVVPTSRKAAAGTALRKALAGVSGPGHEA